MIRNPTIRVVTRIITNVESFEELAEVLCVIVGVAVIDTYAELLNGVYWIKKFYLSTLIRYYIQVKIHDTLKMNFLPSIF